MEKAEGRTAAEIAQLTTVTRDNPLHSELRTYNCQEFAPLLELVKLKALNGGTPN